MNQSFNYWKKQHDNASLEQSNTDVSGQLWLKLKFIIRPELIKDFTNKNNLVLSSSTASKQFEELFAILSKNITASHKLLDKYIQEKNKLIPNDLDTNKLVSELYKLKVFEWGSNGKLERIRPQYGKPLAYIRRGIYLRNSILKIVRMNNELYRF